MQLLNVVTHVFVYEEELDHLVPAVNFFEVRHGLLQPLFEKAGADLCLALVQETVDAPGLA